VSDVFIYQTKRLKLTLHMPWCHVGEWRIAPLNLDLAVDWDEWSVSCPGHTIFWERAPSTHWVRGCVGPRVGVGILEKKEILPLSAVSPWSVEPITWLQWLSYPHSCTKSELNKLARKLSMPGPALMSVHALCTVNSRLISESEDCGDIPVWTLCWTNNETLQKCAN
jgi:hypothetical protein